MDTNIFLCDYSYHVNRFIIDDRRGLWSYLIRIQTVGYTQALINGQLTQIQPGDLILLKKGEPHYLLINPQDDGGFESADYYVFCDGSWIEDWWERSKKPVLSRIDLTNGILPLLKQIVIVKRNFDQNNQELLSYLLKSLCLYIDLALTESSESFNKPLVANKMKRYIQEHATVSFKIEDVANHVHLSTSRAVHLFKHCFGYTMIQYLNEIRLSLALEKIQYTEMNLEHISESCGFGSYQYFHRAFKQKYKVTPRHYRKLNLE